MTENSQDRWCVSLAARKGAISNTAKPTADPRIDSTDLAAAGIANMYHLRDFRNLAIFDFFNTIGAKRTFDEAVRSEKVPEAGILTDGASPFRSTGFRSCSWKLFLL